MQSFDKLWVLFQFSAVNRFHTERFIGEKPTVAHHSANVGLILIELLGDKCSANLLRAALQHDLEEGITGDIPAPVKWEAGEMLTKLEDRIQEHYEIKVPPLTVEEYQYLKAADVLEAVMTCLEQRRLGNTFIDNVFVRYESYIRDSQLFEFNLPALRLWYSISGAYMTEMRRTPNPYINTNEFW